MNRPIENLEAEALDLSPPERARLASLLLASLEEEPTTHADEVERAWSEEIEKRLNEIRAGNAKLIPAKEVISQHRNRNA